MSKTSILIVEDEGLVAENLRSKLEQLGYDVAGIATTRDEAVTAAIKLKPQLILMDIQLHGKGDGIQAAETIRARYDAPVIYLTAHSDPATLERAKNSGPFGYILKPVEMRDLATQIEMALHKYAADKKAKEQSEWLHVTLASIGDAVIATDTNGDITFLNPVAEHLTGWERSEAVGRPVRDVFRIINEQTRKPAQDPVGKVLRTGKIVGLANHTILIRKDGVSIPIDDSGAPIRDEQGNTLGVVLVFRNISERREAEFVQKTHRERHEILATVAERLLNAEDPQKIIRDLCMLVMEHLDCQVFFNYLIEGEKSRVRLSSYAGVPAETAHKLRRLDFGVGVCGCVARECQCIIADNIQTRSDSRTQFVKELGIQAYFCHPLVTQSKLIGILAFGTKTRPRFTQDEVALLKTVCDQIAVAKQRMLVQQEMRALNQSLEEKVVERTQQAEARSRQLQVLAVELIEAEERERRRISDYLHDDLQQMLAAAMLQLDAVVRQKPDTPELSNITRLLDESIEKSRRLSHELSPPVLHHGDLAAALNWITRYFSERFDLQVTLSIRGRHQAESAALRAFIFRAVQELLFNVVKHGGIRKARIDLAETGNALELTVSDKGRGFDPEILDGSAATSGLGLLSLRERARYIGGGLKIESAPGRGSRFTLTVPFEISKLDAAQPSSKTSAEAIPAETARADGSTETRVLFVDDHQVMRQGLINLIGAQPGICVAGEASTGLEAIEQVKRLNPDVIVMDVSMPEMNGIEATRIIKAQWPEVRIIALSMVEDEHIARTMIEAGAETFISKTASSTELLQAIFGISVAG